MHDLCSCLRRIFCLDRSWVVTTNRWPKPLARKFESKEKEQRSVAFLLEMARLGHLRPMMTLALVLLSFLRHANSGDLRHLGHSNDGMLAEEKGGLAEEKGGQFSISVAIESARSDSIQALSEATASSSSADFSEERGLPSPLADTDPMRSINSRGGSTRPEARALGQQGSCAGGFQACQQVGGI